MIREASFQGVEPTFHPQGIPAPENLQKGVEVLRALGEKTGLKIPSLRGGPLFWEVFPFRSEETLSLTRKALEAVEIMGGYPSGGSRKVDRRHLLPGIL